GPELLVFAQLVLANNAVRCVKDNLSRPIVLLQQYDLCLREILLKLKQHLGVGSAPAIDRVMRHDAIGNEVMRLLNIEVVDGSVQRNGFYLLDRVVPPLTVEEQHTAAHRCCGQKG